MTGSLPPSLPRVFVPAAPGEGSASSVSLLSWNVLADGLSSGSFVRTPPESLTWPGRGERILDAIRTAGGARDQPDLICLQEVDHFADLFEPRLRADGYEGAFVAKSAGRDGCCLFWRHERFTSRWVRTVRYVGTDGREQTQVALLAALDDRASGAPLLIATTHLKAKPGHEEKRAAQARQLVDAIGQAADELGADAGVIVAGDLNDVPGSLAHRAMRDGGLGLRSAYAALGGDREPEWTTWKVRAAGEVRRTIDYVFYRPGTLRPVAALGLPADADVGETRLPSWRYPSDHLSLRVEFERD